MNYGSKILDDMFHLIELFEPHCDDQLSLANIKDMVGKSHRWAKAKALHSEIRHKTNKASKSGDKRAECQYLFEEICAKTLYNMSRSSAPFDPDSPYWILPNALYLSRAIGIRDSECIEAIMGDEPLPYSHLL